MELKRNCIKGEIRLLAFLAATALLLPSCGKQPIDPDTSEASKNSTLETENNSTAETDNNSKENAVTIIGVETGYYYDDYWDEASDRIAASVKYPYMHLSESDRQTYPKLEQAIAALMQERKENALKLYKEAVKAAKETPVEDPDHPPFFEVTETVTVRRADSRVFSLILEGSYYTGGPHKQPYTVGAVFDTETGKRLQLTDVATHEGVFKDSVKEQLEAFWNKDELYEDLNLDKFFAVKDWNVAWVLDYHGLSIYFQPYDIAPYASGVQNVTIPFSLNPEPVKEEYCVVPESYGIEFTAEKPFFFDLDGDGKTDSLTVSAAKGESEKQSVTLNGEKFEEDTGISLIEPTLMHTSDGKNYLYIGQQYPDDCWAFEIFDLSKGTLRKVDTVYAGRHSVVDYEKQYYARQVLTDPNRFVLDTYTQMLGTAYGYDSYHVGTDGLPVQEHDWHIICFETKLTLRKNLTVSVVSEDGKTTGTTKLKTGDQALYYRTDGETWADLKLSDGRIVRVHPKHGDGEWTLDGMDLEKVFDGIVFGG